MQTCIGHARTEHKNGQCGGMATGQMPAAVTGWGDRADPTLRGKLRSKSIVCLDAGRRPGEAGTDTRRRLLAGATVDEATGGLGLVKVKAPEKAGRVARPDRQDTYTQIAMPKGGHEVDLAASEVPPTSCSLSPHALKLARKLCSRATPLHALLEESCAGAHVSGQDFWCAAVELLGPDTSSEACDAVHAAAQAVSPNTVLTEASLLGFLGRHAAARRARSASRERSGPLHRPAVGRLRALSSLPAITARMVAVYDRPQRQQ